MILIIKHIDIEGPGTIEDYLKARNFTLKTINLHEGDPLPDDFSNIEAIVSLGGPMNVYEEDKFPFLKAEDDFLKKAIREEIPLLGICLGSQLIAKACGAKVVKSPLKEVGWFKIYLQKEARSDPLFQGLTKEVEVFHWHEDMFEIPTDATLLATAEGCPHQALKVGRCAYGVQFHIEITDEIIQAWCQAYFESNNSEKRRKAEAMIKLYQVKKKELQKSCTIIYQNFVKLIEERKKELNLAAK